MTTQITPPRAAPLLSDAEIIRRLREIRHSGGTERFARRAPTLNAIAKAAGVARQSIYAILSTGAGLGPQTKAKLSHALTCLELGGERTQGRSAPGEPGKP